MKTILYAMFREAAEAWLGQWFVPREDYEFVQRLAEKRENQYVAEVHAHNSTRQTLDGLERRVGAPAASCNCEPEARITNIVSRSCPRHGTATGYRAAGYYD